MLVLGTEERLTLERLANRRNSARAMAMRAHIVLCCAKGDTNREVAQHLGVSQALVGKWRRRFVEHHLDGLSDDPRHGVPLSITDDQVEAVIVKTLEEKPDDATHWSTHSIAEEVGLSQTTIRGSGMPSASSPTGLSRSSIRPTRCSSRRCGTSWATTSTPPPERAMVLCEQGCWRMGWSPTR
jgi:transposase